MTEILHSLRWGIDVFALLVGLTGRGVAQPPEQRQGLPFSVASWAKWSVRTNGFLGFIPELGS
jgi:hypothetical protein